MRKGEPVIASSMDGAQDVRGVFKDKCKALYNSTDDEAEVANVLREVEAMVTQSRLNDIIKVTPTLVKKAAMKLKPGKSDPFCSPP